jgi:AraC-like DNA-binding protein
MRRSGTSTFANPEDYCANFRSAGIDLTFTGPGPFKANLTWLKLPQLQLMRAVENLPRIAFFTMAPARVHISFPVSSDAHQIWCGVELRPGDIVFHSRGERAHERTRGVSQKGFISLTPELLAECSKAVIGMELVPPSVGRVLRPPQSAAKHLLRLHAKACHLAEAKPEILAHREVARALEQEFLHVLVNCLTADDAFGHLATRRDHVSIMMQLEEVLIAHIDQELSVPKLCSAVGVPERTLRMCCAKFLGMGPSQFLRLRRLNLIRAALQYADPTTASVADIARRYQFSELGRFAAAYRTVFGELPSTTLARIHQISVKERFAEIA